jgi:hypothetical protein
MPSYFNANRVVPNFKNWVWAFCGVREEDGSGFLWSTRPTPGSMPVPTLAFLLSSSALITSGLCRTERGNDAPSLPSCAPSCPYPDPPLDISVFNFSTTPFSPRRPSMRFSTYYHNCPPFTFKLLVFPSSQIRFVYSS